jgi:Lrp/AsnC family transcriptional regulator for asnA, asnC and gidA
MLAAVDDLDRRIIAILQRDGRTPYVEMARALDVAEGTIRRRVENLIAGGVIDIAAVTDPFKVGIGIVALMDLDVDPGHLDDVGKRLIETPCVRVVAYTTGVHDLFVEALFPSQQELLTFLKDELPQVPGIRHTDTSIVLGMLKRSYEWEIPQPE